MFEKLKQALLSVTPNVGHFVGPDKGYPYIVWGEDGQGDTMFEDDKMISQIITGTVDYFTKTENDPAFRKIQKALTAAGIPYQLNSVQYEPEKKVIHYEWLWEIENGEL